jgi:hypothetical protein
MSLFKAIVDFVKSDLASAQAPTQPAVPVIDENDIPPGGRFRVEIVGEAHYQAVLARLAGKKTKDGVSVYKAALLFPEPTNRHDRNAVSVRIGGETVGYLSREQAVRFHRSFAGHGRVTEVSGPFKAWVHGGWKRPGDEGSYAVTLFLADKSLGQAIGSED